MPSGPIVKFFAGPDEVPCKTWQISIFRNEPAKFSVTIVEPTDAPSQYAPGVVTEYFDSRGSTSYPWSVTATWPDGSHADWTTCPRFVQDDYQFVGDEESNTIEVSGGDFSLPLIRHQDEAMNDVEDLDSSDIIDEIGVAYDFTPVQNQPSFVIQKMHRIGCPLDWLRQIFEINQAWYRWEDDTMIIDQTTFPKTPDWVLTDRHHLKLISYRRSMAEVYNTVTIERTDGISSTGIVGRLSKSGPDSLGIQEFTFDTPVYVARPVINVKRGRAITFTYRDSEGNPLTTFAPAASLSYYNYTTPAYSVTWIAEPGVTAAAEGPYTPQYEGYFWGVTSAPTGSTPADYVVPYSDSVDVAIHGTLRYPRPITNLLIPDAATAAIFAQRWVAESVRTYVTASVSILFNPHILPGHCVSLTDYYAGLSGDLFSVDSVHHSGAEDNAITRLELMRPAALE